MVRILVVAGLGVKAWDSGECMKLHRERETERSGSHPDQYGLPWLAAFSCSATRGAGSLLHAKAILESGLWSQTLENSWRLLSFSTVHS